MKFVKYLFCVCSILAFASLKAQQKAGAKSARGAQLQAEKKKIESQRDEARDQIRGIASEIAIHEAAIKELKDRRQQLRTQVTMKNEEITLKEDEIKRAQAAEAPAAK